MEPKIALEAKISPFYEIKTGLSYLNIHYDQDLIDRGTYTIVRTDEMYPDTTYDAFDENLNSFPQNTDAKSYKVAGYAENIIQLSDNLMMNAGMRLDYFAFNRDLTVSPRLSVSYTLDNGMTLRAAWGYYYQSPIYTQLAYSVASDSNTQSQKAEHYILSLERNATFGTDEQNTLTLKVEGYYKDYSSLISSTRSNTGDIYYSRRNDATGYATGLDLYASLKLPGYYGWVSYGLLFANEDLLTDNEGSIPRSTDQRHTLSIVNDIDLGKRWSLNLRFTYGSGFAFTPFHVEYNIDEARYTWVEGKRNSEHLPEYKRVDMRLAKEFELFGLSAFVFLDVSNLFNFTNVFSFRYRYDGNGSPYREDVGLWPILPSIGMTVKF
jgi:outer membrane receptor protein involved in Fe transport